MAANSRKVKNSHKGETYKPANSHKPANLHKPASSHNSLLNAEQKALLQKLGLPTNFKNLSTDDRLEIDDVIGEELYENGIDEATDVPNAYGRLCESLLEALES